KLCGTGTCSMTNFAGVMPSGAPISTAMATMNSSLEYATTLATRRRYAAACGYTRPWIRQEPCGRGTSSKTAAWPSRTCPWPISMATAGRKSSRLADRRITFAFIGTRARSNMRQSAGTLLYRGSLDNLEVLLVHPSGSYNRRAPWSIPKGEPGDEANLEETARRETVEETGVVAGPLITLGDIVYTKSRKRVFCYAGPAPDNAQPQCASWEIDKAQF